MNDDDSMLRRIFGSSKNVMALGSLIVAWAAYFGLNVPPWLIGATLAMVAIAIGARAHEDAAAKRAPQFTSTTLETLDPPATKTTVTTGSST